MSPKYTMEKLNEIADGLCNKNNLIRLEDCIDRNKRFKTITKEGYYVYPSIKSLRQNEQPSKFHPINPDTVINIRLWLKLNNKTIKLVSDIYEGNNKNMKWLCKNNECINYNKEFLKPWRFVQQNHGCNDCGALKRKKTQQNKIPPKDKSLFDIYKEICDNYWDYQRNNKMPNQYYSKSYQNVYWKCNECNYELPDKIKISHVVQYGLSCPRCSDGLSYPEKFMYNVLLQLNINFKKGKIFNWSKNIIHKNKKLCGNKIYDFWIEFKSCIIETHGGQHYKKSQWIGEKSKNLQEQQENDKIKEKLAKDNNIKNYISIDCRKSDLEYIKNNILSSQLNKLFDLSNINWEEVHKKSCKSKVKEVCDLWDGGINNINRIIKIIHLSRSTIIDFLKRGNEIGWCKYIPQEEKNKRHFDYEKITNIKPVIQLTMERKYINRYNGVREATRILNCHHVSDVCNNKRKSTGGFIFMFEKDYINNNENILL